MVPPPHSFTPFGPFEAFAVVGAPTLKIAPAPVNFVSIPEEDFLFDPSMSVPWF